MRSEDKQSLEKKNEKTQRKIPQPLSYLGGESSKGNSSLNFRRLGEVRGGGFYSERGAGGVAEQHEAARHGVVGRHDARGGPVGRVHPPRVHLS